MNTKISKKQLFAFSTPIETFLNINEKTIITWKDTSSIFYGFNDVMSELTDIPTSVSKGKQDEDILVVPEHAVELRQHDQEVIISRNTKTFVEACKVKNRESPNWLCIKTPLCDNVNRIMGVFVLGFPLDEINLRNISKIINNTKFNTRPNTLPSMMMLPQNSEKTKLTKRQHECLYHLAHGRTAKGIARILSISPKTVENHLEQVKIKLKCCTKSQLISKVWDEGFLN